MEPQDAPRKWAEWAGVVQRPMRLVPVEVVSCSKTRFRAVTWCFAAGSRRGWDHLEVLLSLLYRLLRCLFGLLAVLVRSDLSKDVELLVLRQENQVLRRRLGARPRWDHADRL
jgi:putative transposase